MATKSRNTKINSWALSILHWESLVLIVSFFIITQQLGYRTKLHLSSSLTLKD